SAVQRPGLRAGIGVLAILWLCGSGARTSAFVRKARDEGAGGFATESWQRSPLAAGLETPLPAADGAPPAAGSGDRHDVPILSNEPAAVYLLTGRPASQSPRSTLYRSDAEPAEDLDRLKRLIETRGAAQLAWFDAIETPHVRSPDDLSGELARSFTGR